MSEKHAGGRPLKFSSPEDLQTKIDAYFDRCDETGEIYTITGLALALDTSRKVLVEYEDKEEYSNTIKRAKSRVEHAIEQGAMQNKYNSTFSIFNLKNNYGWVDRNETDLTSKGEKIVVPILGGESTNVLSDNSDTQSSSTT